MRKNANNDMWVVIMKKRSDDTRSAKDDTVCNGMNIKDLGMGCNSALGMRKEVASKIDV